MTKFFGALACLVASALLPSCGVPGLDLAEDTGGDLDIRWNEITHGTVDVGHPSVGQLIIERRACTGTLIGSRTVLTASHCGLPDATGVFILGTQRLAVGRFVRHPAYCGGNCNDVAVALLSAPVSGVQPSPLSRSSPRAGQSITLVGFGYTREGGGGLGTKRMGVNTISRVRERTFSFLGTGRGESNICNGDSGGPAFIEVEGVEYVAGVHSTKMATCGFGGTDMRVDRHLTFIINNAADDLSAALSSR